MHCRYILKHTVDETYHYFHSSYNNFNLLNDAFFMDNRGDLNELVDYWLTADKILEEVYFKRPNSKYTVSRVTNITGKIDKVKK